MKVYLIHSYRGHGKDSLHLHPELFNWSPKEIPDFKKKERRAFADEVKKEAYPLLFGGEGREEKIFVTREMKESKRPEIVRYAEDKKKEDPYHWARRVVSSLENLEEVVITDWRFPCEREYLLSLGWECITIRVVSLKEKVPPMEEEGEHLLDDVEDDYTAVWKE